MAASRMALPLALVCLAFSPSLRADEDPDTEIARKHFDEGTRRYDAKDYAGALSEFQAAKLARPAPALDFNIGRCLDRLERWTDAIAAYERYAASKPTPSDAVDVRARVVQLRARVATLEQEHKEELERREEERKRQAAEQPLAPPSNAGPPIGAPPGWPQGWAPPPGTVPVQLVAKRPDYPYRARLLEASCITPCTMFVRPGKVDLTVEGRGSFTRTIDVPSGGAQVRIEHRRTGRLVAGGIVGTIGLGCILSTIVLATSNPNTSAVGVAFLTGITGVVTLPLGIGLAASSDRDRATVLGPGAPVAAAPPPGGLRLVGAGLAPSTSGVAAGVTLSF